MRLFVVAFAVMLGLPTLSSAQIDRQRVDLNVAIFAYLPDASTAIKQIEERFERRYPTVDLDLELWNPYDDAFEDNGLSRIVNFDVVEVDTCRIDELLNGKFGGIDEIPVEASLPADAHVGPAKTIIAGGLGKYIVPHWVCGNFLIHWKENASLAAAVTFEDFLKAANPTDHPLLTVMWGKTGLGELYADAMIDLNGPQATRQHLVGLANGSVSIDIKARDLVLELAKKLAPDNRTNLEHFSNHNYLLPRQFANNPQSILLGYSERLYYTERELQLTPKKYPPQTNAANVTVRQFAFSTESKGTPTWTDAFVIPKGRTQGKRAAIAAFLQFIVSEDAYLAFSEPAPYLAPTYLLPAIDAHYKASSPVVKKQPLLPQYKAALDGGFPVSDSSTWQGMRKAGTAIRSLLQQ